MNGLEVEELSGELINEDDYYYDFGYSAAKAVVKIPYLIDSGKYYMKFTVKDEYLKHEDVIEKVLVVEEELNVAGIQSAFYVDEEDFSIIPVDSFTSEDMVYIYSELSGFKQAKTIHGYKYDFRQEVEVVGENVSGVMENEYQGVSKELLAYFKARNYFLAEGLEPGVYGVKVKLIDRIASKEVVEEGYFIIE